jgi:basic membrane protein A
MLMKLTKSLLTALITILPAISAAQSAPVKLSGPPRIAFLFNGNPADSCWDKAQDMGRKALEAAYDQRIPFADDVPEVTERAEQEVDLFINHGVNIIIAGSYGYSDAFAAEAKSHPDVAFVNINGGSTAPNLESFFARTDEAWFLAGMAAGFATKSKTLGIIEGFPIPNVLKEVNAFALGAAATNPGTIVKVAFVDSWSDPVKEAQVTTAMIGQGADVIAAGTDTPAAIIVAEAAGKKSIGFQVDMAKEAPNGILTSVVFHWEKELIPMVKQIADDNWTSKGIPLYGIKTGVVDNTPFQHLSADQITNIENIRAKIMAGTFSPWSGPIIDQSGKVQSAPGTTLPDASLQKMNFLVSNVQGSMK